MPEPSALPVTASVSRRSTAIAEAAGDVVVDETDALHERIDDRRTDEAESPPSEVCREAVGVHSRCRDRAKRRVRTEALRRRWDDGREVCRERPELLRRREERSGVADGREDLGPVAH